MKDFNMNGILLDVSRGQVPRKKLMKKWLSIFSEYNINFISLYMEHTFPYPSYPLFWKHTGAWNANEIRFIIKFAKQYQISVIPAIQTLGHFEKILRHKEYAHLTETELYYSLSPSNPNVYVLLEQMIKEISEVFPSPYINIGGDEVWDMGEGNSKKMLKKLGSKRKFFFHHLNKVVNLCEKYDKQAIVWGDMFFEFDKVNKELKDRILVFNWEYEEENLKALESKIIKLKQKKIKQVVCSGASTWSVLFPDVEKAMNNIKNSIKAGENQKNGVQGYMITTWGDDENFNFLGESLPGFLFFSYMVTNNKKIKKIGVREFNVIFEKFWGIPNSYDFFKNFTLFGSFYKKLALKKNYEIFYLFWKNPFLIEFSNVVPKTEQQLHKIYLKLFNSYKEFNQLTIRKNKTFYQELLYKMKIILFFFDRYFVFEMIRQNYKQAFQRMWDTNFVEERFKIIFNKLSQIRKQTSALKKRFASLMKNQYKGEALLVNRGRFSNFENVYFKQYEEFRILYKFYKKKGGGLIQPSELLLNKKNVGFFNKKFFLLDFYKKK